MFNIGPGELMAIAAVALIVLGPQRLPQALRSVGRVIGELRRISGGFQDELRRAIEDADVNDADLPDAADAGRKRNVIGASSATTATDATAPEVEGATPIAAETAGTDDEPERAPEPTDELDEDDDTPARAHVPADDEDDHDEPAADEAADIATDDEDDHDEPERIHVPADEPAASGNGVGIGEVEGARPVSEAGDRDQPVDDAPVDAGDGDQRAAS